MSVRRRRRRRRFSVDERHEIMRGVYLSTQYGGSVRFALGFVAGILLRETHLLRNGRRPPKSVLVPVRGYKGNSSADRVRETEGPDAGPLVFVRRLEAGDYAKGFMELLAVLTTVGDVAEGDFIRRVRDVASGPEYVYVVEENGRIIATGTLVVERKFARSCGVVGHIEDIAVLTPAQGRGLGKVIIHALMRVAERMGCYKVILDCAEKNVAFYEKCGLTQKEIQMVKYFID